MRGVEGGREKGATGIDGRDLDDRIRQALTITAIYGHSLAYVNVSARTYVHFYIHTHVRARTHKIRRAYLHEHCTTFFPCTHRPNPFPRRISYSASFLSNPTYL